jgi:hypothetical protein
VLLSTTVSLLDLPTSRSTTITSHNQGASLYLLACCDMHYIGADFTALVDPSPQPEYPPKIKAFAPKLRNYVGSSDTIEVEESANVRPFVGRIINSVTHLDHIFTGETIHPFLQSRPHHPNDVYLRINLHIVRNDDNAQSWPSTGVSLNSPAAPYKSCDLDSPYSDCWISILSSPS